MGFKFVILFSVLLVLFLFGCTGTAPVCGDGICSTGEEYICASDCGNNSKEYSLTGYIVPGVDTNLSDLDVLRGKSVSVCGYSITGSKCKTESISNDFVFDLESYPEGVLAINLNSYPEGFYTFDSTATLDDGVPISLDSSRGVYISSDENSFGVSANLGVSYSLKVVEQNNTLSSNEINVLEYCEFYSDGRPDNCMGREGVSWADVFGSNPFTSSFYLNGDSYYSLPSSYSLKLEYNGLIKDFNYTLHQGQNDIILKFSASCTGAIDSNAILYPGDDLGLVIDSPRVLSESNTSTKCEYYCAQGYRKGTGADANICLENGVSVSHGPDVWAGASICDHSYGLDWKWPTYSELCTAMENEPYLFMDDVWYWSNHEVDSLRAYMVKKDAFYPGGCRILTANKIDSHYYVCVKIN